MGNKKYENKGTRCFCKKGISKGTVIGDYIGKIIRPQDAIIDEENFYLMYYHDYAVISPDLKKQGVHLLNHSCKPNAFIYIYKGHTLAFALEKISKGEEITIPYLLSPKDSFCSPCLHICKCGDLECSGTMHLSKEVYKKWKKISEKWAKKTKRERISFGKELPLLKLYPQIPEEYIREIKDLFIFPGSH